MAHVVCEWIPDPIEPNAVVEVEVLVAFQDGAPRRSAGTLRLHAAEANALDRMLKIGASLEQPANTYGGMVARRDLVASSDSDPLRPLAALARSENR